jgi:hypothetical protein
VKTEDLTTAKFIGHWRARRGVYCCDWILRDDGTFAAKISVLGIPILRPTGIWSVEGNELVSIYSDDWFNLVERGRKDTDRLLEVAEDYFIIMEREGSRRRYERVYERRVA